MDPLPAGAEPVNPDLAGSIVILEHKGDKASDQSESNSGGIAHHRIQQRLRQQGIRRQPI